MNKDTFTTYLLHNVSSARLCMAEAKEAYRDKNLDVTQKKLNGCLFHLDWAISLYALQQPQVRKEVSK